MQNKALIPLSIIVAGALVAGAIFLTSNKGADNLAPNANNSGTDSIVVAPISDQDHIIGSPDADVIVIEYSDTECPFCKDFHETMQRIIDEYGKSGKVAWVYRHYPIPQLHSKALKEAEATECAAEQGGNDGFWNYIDRVFEVTVSNDTLDPARLPEIATEVGLNRVEFEKCLESGKYSLFIDESRADAVAAGANGTPYNIILTKDGQKAPLKGAYPYETVKTIIESILNQ